MMQQMPHNLVRIVERGPDSLQMLRRIAPHDCCHRGQWSKRGRCVTVMAKSRNLTAQHDALLLRYTGLVRQIAYHLFRRRHYVDVDDLIQAGMVALSETIRRHGHFSTGSFEADASVRIRAAMLEFVRKSDWSLRSARRSLRDIGDAKSAS